MPKRAEERVVARMGARLLTEDEMSQVSGGQKTGMCTFNPQTCAIDGDCSPPPEC